MDLKRSNLHVITPMNHLLVSIMLFGWKKKVAQTGEIIFSRQQAINNRWTTAPGTSPKNIITTLGLPTAPMKKLNPTQTITKTFLYGQVFLTRILPTSYLHHWIRCMIPSQLTIPSLVSGEHDKNPPHFQRTQEEDPDYTAWIEEHGNGMHGFHSHLHDHDSLAQNIATYYGMISLM